MTITPTNNQEECLQIVNECGLQHVKPVPPNPICDCLWPMGGGAYLVIRYNRGHYTMFLLQDATEKEAWRFYESLGGGSEKLNPRAEFRNDGLQPQRN